MSEAGIDFDYAQTQVDEWKAEPSEYKFITQTQMYNVTALLVEHNDEDLCSQSTMREIVDTYLGYHEDDYDSDDSFGDIANLFPLDKEIDEDEFWEVFSDFGTWTHE